MQPSVQPVIVAIGASAGGIKALQDFFGTLPTDTGAAFIVVLHLNPEHHSELPSILGSRTDMPVIQVEGRDKLAPDHVYVIAPDRRLQLLDHELSSFEFDEPRGARAPIDILLRSLADGGTAPQAQPARCRVRGRR
jgi:two-component system CheB/CheR fusion protein